ncbi:MAG: tetratricopeptide repeat protein, partial [Gammaproteobacteria bacterium]
AMGDFFAELRRRHMYRIGAGYVVVAWGIAQVIDFLSQVWALPAWIAQPVSIILVVGFLITLVVAWLIEGKAHKAEAAEAVAPATKVDWVIAGGLAVVIALIGYQQLTPEPVVVAAVDEEAEEVSDVLPNSIAVLPFEDLSNDPENAYFAPGIHDTLLNELSKINDMNVISRTSVLRYADGQTPIPQIAAELNVETVMEGTVQYADGQVRITAQLIDPETGAHLWSENYDRDFSGIFVIQTEIASNIAMALEAELLPAEQESIQQPLTDSGDAYALYLRAITAVGDPVPWSPPDLFAEAHAYLDQAIELDPEFARAHAFKALMYATSILGVARVSDQLTVADKERLAREHAETAIRLNPNVGLAYAVLARLHESFFRGTEARQLYEQAYQLSPNDSEILTDFAVFNMWTGRYEEAVRLARGLLELNPGYGHGILAMALVFDHDYDAAAAASSQAIDISPAEPRLHFERGMIEVARGNNARALEEVRLFESLVGDGVLPPGLVPALAYIYALAGSPEDAMRLFARVEAMTAEYSVGPASLGLAYLAIGEEESAFESYTIAAENWAPDKGLMGLWHVRHNLLANPTLEQPAWLELRSRFVFR